ncbi:MAG: GNAT family N-acetyltransferase [Acidimicrobiales bacterium]|jgi:predicted acetyltransferase
MTDFELRPIGAHEIYAFASCQAAAWGGRYTPDKLESLAEELQLDRSLAVFEGGDLVATSSSYLIPMTLPGLVRCEVAAVTDVAVAPTHRRRGLLNSMMRRQLDDLHSADEILAVLYASEGGIYGRYGYGPATFGARYEVDKRHAGLMTPVATRCGSSTGDGPGSVRLLELAQAAEAFPVVHAAYVPTRVGEMDRSHGEWAELLGSPNDAGEETRHRFYACYVKAGRIDGYAVYRVGPIDPADRRRRAVMVEELCSLSDESYTSLWRYLLGIDLTEQLRTGSRPVDEPLRYLFADQGRLRTVSLTDRIWVRLVDAERALARRRYQEGEALVIEVEDPFCPWNEGRFRLSVDSGGTGTVERVAAAPDLVVPVEALGALYLGGVPFTGMAEVGRIGQCTEGAARRADEMFGVRRAPFCMSHF